MAEVKDMNLEEVIARMSQIKEDMEKEDADIKALSTEADELIERKTTLIAERKAAVEEVLAGAGETISEHQENKNMEENKITRDSQEYIEAFGEYKRTGDDTIVRSLLMSENAEDGTVAVPTVVEDAIEKAWKEDQILSRVKQSSYKGNLEVNFFISGSAAIVHTEGARDPISDEDLSLGIRTLVPIAIKKNLPVTRQALKLRGAAFLDFLKDEVYDAIVYKAGGELINDIKSAPSTSTASMPGVPVVTTDTGASDPLTLSLLDEAQGVLSAKAKRNPVWIMNPQTKAYIKSLAKAHYYAIDPFDGIPVIEDDRLPAYTSAHAGDTYIILGDLSYGARANFPDGKDVEILVDKMTNKKKNVVDIFGEMFLSIGICQQNAFVKIAKAGGSASN